MSAPALTSDQNILPVQAYFNLDGSFNTFIGQGQPFYATLNPVQSGLTITNSTINSSSIGLVTPSSGAFTNISTTTGSISTTPSNPTDLVNKNYVDMYVQGYAIKAECQVATTGNITLSGLQTIDGYTTLANDRVLVKNQNTSSQNGIYVASSGAWSRSSDANTWNSLISAFTFIMNGTTQQNSGWVCTISSGGTLGVTPVTWSQLANAASYFAGTGLTLSAYTFSITPVGTAGTYGSASSVPVFVTNASGQVSSVTNTSISIAPSQINATIPNSGLTNSSITINGTNIALGGSGTITATASNALTIGTGLSGTSYNGSTPVTIAIDSTVVTLTGSQTLTNKTLTAPVISTITNVGTLTLPTSTDTLVGRATTDTLTNKSIAASTNTITGLTNSNLSGTAGITNGNLANSSVTVNGTAISLGGSGTVTANTPNSVTFNSSGTGGTSPTSFNGGSAVTVSYNTLGASPLAGSSSLTTVGTIASGTWNGSVIGLSYGGTNANLTANAGGIVYSGASALAISAAGSTGQYLQSNGTGAPTWATPSASVTISDQTLSSSTFYPTFVNATSGTTSTIDTSSTKLQYVPSTGTLTSTAFSGSGASLTSLTAGNLSGTIPSAVLGNSTVYIGTTAILLNRASGSINLTGTNIDGSAGSATTATTATNALNVQVTDNTSSSSTFYPTLSPGTTGSTNYALGTSSTKLSFAPNTGTLTTTALVSTGGSIDNTPIGATTANTGKFTTLEVTGTSTLGDASTTYIQVVGDAFYPAIKAAGGTNTPLVLQPLGTGALQAQQTTSSATGGNARGANAVDWQTSRTTAAQVASGAQSVISGGQNNTTAGTQAVVVGGSTNTTNYSYQFIGAGINNILNGSPATASAIVAGQSNTISGGYSGILNGHLNTASGYFNLVVGGESNSATSSSTVTTQTTTIAVTASTTLYLSSTNASIKVGQLILGTGITSISNSNSATYATSSVTTGTPAVMATSTISGTTLTVGSLTSGTIIAGQVLTGTGVTVGTYIVSGSGSTWTVSASQSVSSTTITGTAYTFTISQNATTAANITLSFYTPHGVVVGGGNNQATGSYSFIGGGGDAGTAANRNVASGDWSFVGGGQVNQATGNKASIVGGATNIASALQSFVGGGVANNNSGINAYIIAGTNNQATGNNSGIFGGTYATTRGITAYASIGSSSPLGTTVGATQAGFLVIAGTTTTTGSIALLSDGSSSAGSGNQLVLPNGQTGTVTVYTFRVLISAHNSANTTDIAGWQILGVISRGNGVGTTALVGTPSVTLLGATTGAILAGWGTVSNVAAVADTTYGALQIQVTGVASTTIRWSARVETNELAY